MFFFIYHIEKGREKSPGLGMSPCPEYDLALALEEGLAEIEKHRAVLYDPQVVDACLSLFRKKNFQLTQ